MTEPTDRDQSTAQEHGIVDQQDAALEAMEDGTPAPGSQTTDSTAERHGIVDQQDAALAEIEEEREA